jgi:esterase/lipase
MTRTIDTNTLGPHPRPTRSYGAAMKRIGVLQLADAIAAPGGGSIVLVHGERTARAIVLFHGFTNSPRQFRRIAEELYARGANVFAPRLAYHGLHTGTVHQLSHLTAELLRDHADTAIDIAHGLGDTVIVSGLSLGGSLAAWSAQFRPEVTRAVPISPALALAHVPPIPDPVLLRLVLHVPDHTRSSAPDRSRPDRTSGWSTHAIGQMVRLGLAIRHAAHEHAPAARHILMLLNAHDHTVSRARNLDLAESWSAAGGNVSVWECPDALHLPHDLVDPDERFGNVAASYPVILALIDGLEPRADLANRLDLERGLASSLESNA